MVGCVAVVAAKYAEQLRPEPAMQQFRFFWQFSVGGAVSVVVVCNCRAVLSGNGGTKMMKLGMGVVRRLKLGKVWN